MKNKIVETIRRILIKIILPLRRKKKAFYGKMRLSMTYRIARNYLKLLILNGFLFFIVFFFLFLGIRRSEYSELAEHIIVNLETNGQVFGRDANPYADRGVTMQIYEKESKREVYNDVRFSISDQNGLFGWIHYSSDNSEYRLVLEETDEIYMKGQEYEVIFYYNMSKDYGEMWRLILNMAFVYIIVIFFIIKEGKRDNVRMLAPIQQMSDTVNRLTVNNLNSERLNVEGTKNELRDLAVVFNNMLDRLETSYESQKQFVSDASHELRTPIAVVQGYINMLDRWGSKDPDILQESIEAIQNEAKMMQDLVEKLLFLSRHDKKSLKLEKMRFNMRQVVEDMIKETKLVTVNRTVECPALEDVDVYGDKQSLKQAIRVFIDNAAKYTKEGDVIFISCKNVHGDCVVTVEDTGIGMKKKDIDNIFNRFYRSDTVRDQKIEGHGLGLSIARLIIGAHSGRIKIRTQFTKGTCFIITLPRRPQSY